MLSPLYSLVNKTNSKVKEENGQNDYRKLEQEEGQIEQVSG